MRVCLICPVHYITYSLQSYSRTRYYIAADDGGHRCVRDDVPERVQLVMCLCVMYEVFLHTRLRAHTSIHSSNNSMIQKFFKL